MLIHIHVEILQNYRPILVLPKRTPSLMKMFDRSNDWMENFVATTKWWFSFYVIQSPEESHSDSMWHASQFSTRNYYTLKVISDSDMQTRFAEINQWPQNETWLKTTHNLISFVKNSWNWVECQLQLWRYSLCCNFNWIKSKRHEADVKHLKLNSQLATKRYRSFSAFSQELGVDHAFITYILLQVASFDGRISWEIRTSAHTPQI